MFTNTDVFPLLLGSKGFKYYPILKLIYNESNMHIVGNISAVKIKL